MCVCVCVGVCGIINHNKTKDSNEPGKLREPVGEKRPQFSSIFFAIKINEPIKPATSENGRQKLPSPSAFPSPDEGSPKTKTGPGPRPRPRPKQKPKPSEGNSGSGVAHHHQHQCLSLGWRCSSTGSVNLCSSC